MEKEYDSYSLYRDSFEKERFISISKDELKISWMEWKKIFFSK